MKNFTTLLMKTVLVSAGFTALLAFGGDAPLAKSAEAQIQSVSQNLNVNVTGLQGKSGIVRIALFNSEASYIADQPMSGESLPARSEGVTFTFTQLPAGQYAYKLFLDEDEDREVDTNALGIPTEDYAFSQNASDPFSAPEWAEAKFELSSKSQGTRSISLD